MATQIRTERQLVLDVAYAEHPERFVRGRPVPPMVPTAVWINPPPLKSLDEEGKDLVA